jgi:hypothetical protein
MDAAILDPLQTISDSTDSDMKAKVHCLQVWFFRYLAQTMLLYKTGLVVMLEILSLNFCSGAAYPDWHVFWFSSAPPGKFQDSAPIIP